MRYKKQSHHFLARATLLPERSSNALFLDSVSVSVLTIWTGMFFFPPFGILGTGKGNWLSFFLFFPFTSYCPVP
jgi:hypothetical protein